MSLQNSKRFLSDSNSLSRLLDEKEKVREQECRDREQDNKSPISEDNKKERVMMYRGEINLGKKKKENKLCFLKKIHVFIEARARRNRAVSIGQKDNPKISPFDIDASTQMKSLDLEEATMKRSSSGNLRESSQPLQRSLSDGKLNDFLDNFLKLDRELIDVMKECNEEVSLILNGNFHFFFFFFFPLVSLINHIHS